MPLVICETCRRDYVIDREDSPQLACPQCARVMRVATADERAQRLGRLKVEAVSRDMALPAPGPRETG